jgi:hypothetical protein
VLSQRALCRGGREHRVEGTRKRDEERVSLGVDLPAAVGGERVAQQPLVLAKSVAIALAQLFEQAC